MHPAKVVRDKVRVLTDLPNIGPAAARDYERLGYREPGQLRGVDPLELYQALCVATATRHDPCVLDVFMSVADFLDGAEPAAWWHYTAQRKQRYGQLDGPLPPASPGTREHGR
ncbi:helix-hairpin-helix domain-containing protein [Pseudoxanthomonas sp. 10H]|uniref:helix-hairpin-helix domain-containing protein n=1 Tax=Pseudoxanthomonas sp. 10H TaxID=3242729 RepID=UPI003557A2C9